MSQVLVTEQHLRDIAYAIRSKLGASDTYRPGEMAAAIQEIDTSGIHPAGTVAIGANGTVDVTQYASAAVDVQPNLQSKTVTRNGTVTPDTGYDGLSSVVVDIQGGGGSAGLLKMHQLGYYTNEYRGNIYGSSAIEGANLVLLGDFSQTGAASGNVLADAISNYSALLLQGIYQAQRTSGYNTTMMYINPQLNTAYWAGMKDRNSSYDCRVTFTDDTHCSLSGNRQVIIYGLP